MPNRGDLSAAGSEHLSVPDIEVIDASPDSQRSDETLWSYPQSLLGIKLPDEIIQQVYCYLHPKDFNAARHTCRSWMNASLDRTTLSLMLQRGAWWSGSQAQMRELIRDTEETSRSLSNDIWLMSCIASRECALAGDWTGNGLLNLNDNTLPIFDHHWGQYPNSLCSTAKCAMAKFSVFQQVARAKFSDLASGYRTPGKSASLVFTASACGNYLLVAEGGMIYVYKLFGDDLRALTSVICPRKVLGMNMDASSRRFALAALMEGRMGMMCNLHIAARGASDDMTPGVVIESSTRHRHCPVSTIFRTRLYPQNDRLTFPELGTGVGRLALDSGSSTDVFEIQSEDDAELIEDDYTEPGREMPRSIRPRTCTFPAVMYDLI